LYELGWDVGGVGVVFDHQLLEVAVDVLGVVDEPWGVGEVDYCEWCYFVCDVFD